MKKIILISMCFMMGLCHAYSQSINYLSTTNGAIIPTALPITDYFGPSNFGGDYGVCGIGSWDWIHALCSSVTINSPDSSTKLSNNEGSTWFASGGVQYMVVDLGEVRTFDEFRVFQMMDSDGKVTHAAMYVYPDTNEVVAPIFSNASWSSIISESVVNDGVISGNVVTSPTVFTFPETKARFLKFEFRNDGRYGLSGYLEVRELKLFNRLGTGLNNNNNKVYVSIYPNPTSGLFTIDMGDNHGKVSYTILTIDGRIITRGETTTQNKIEIDLTDENRGLYFLKVNNDKEIATYKIVKE